MNVTRFLIGCLLLAVPGAAVVAGDYTPAYSGKEPVSGKGVYDQAPIGPEIDYHIQALNPIANVRMFGIENYYFTDFEAFNDDANQFLLRYAEPFSLGGGDWLFRTNLPVNHFPDGGNGYETGLGDLSLAFSYLFPTANPNVSWSFGPTFRFPTATNDSFILGTEKWSAGLSHTYFNGANEKIQFGYTVSWQQSFLGGSGRDHFHVGALQPFVFYQLGNGWYTGTAPTFVYDFESDDYNFPLGVRLGRVVEKRKGICNFWIEPQWSVADRGPALPDWQIWAGLTIQFWDYPVIDSGKSSKWVYGK